MRTAGGGGRHRRMGFDVGAIKYDNYLIVCMFLDLNYKPSGVVQTALFNTIFFAPAPIGML
jgi:hypothetical protein